MFTFKDTAVNSRIGISYISPAKACQHLDNEIPAKTTIQSLASKAKATWNSAILSKIQVTGGSDADKQLLYSSLLGMFLIPTNKTGENPKWTGQEPYYDDIITFWDTHRCHTSLFHILEPVAYEEFIRSLIDIWRHDGFLPDARSSNFNGRVQGGSNADNVLADAYVKGLRGAINWDDGYSAMKVCASVWLCETSCTELRSHALGHANKSYRRTQKRLHRTTMIPNLLNLQPKKDAVRYQTGLNMGTSHRHTIELYLERLSIPPTTLASIK